MSLYAIRLAGPTDIDGFRAAARACLAQGRDPATVSWATSAEEPGLFGALSDDVDARPAGPARPVPRVSRAFLDIVGSALLHVDPDRFGLVYRLLWRMHDEPGLASLASDPDVVRLTRLAKAVRRDIHKMHAFVRFRVVASGAPDGTEAHIAWYEPDHHVVEAAAPFFARRFASLSWSILTPRRSVAWIGRRLVFGEAARPGDVPSDDGGEALWRAYYASIFNPARVNPAAMKAEMPVRFWKNLPEADLIRDLVAQAPARAAAMVAAAPTEPVLRRGSLTPQPAAIPEAGGLENLAAAAHGCRACPLWEQATQAVPGEGPAGAALMVVGEQPGDEEDLAGRPFVGPAGRLLDRALARAGIVRSGVYLTNAVKHFKFAPRGKRRLHKRPEAREIHACLPWLEREVAEVDPRAVLMLGASAARAVLGETVAVTRARGEPFQLRDGRWGLIATHPAYVLRLPNVDQARIAFDGLVADLEKAARLAGLSQSAERDPQGGEGAIRRRPGDVHQGRPRMATKPS